MVQPVSLTTEGSLGPRFWVALGVVAVIRWVYLAAVGLDLSPDEAYYWNWSQHLDFGYFSKPPGIAWLNAASTGLLGVSTWAVRFPAVLLGTGTLALLCLTARDLYGPRAAWVTLGLLLATPANVAMNFVMTIDSPLAFGWALALWAITSIMVAGCPRREVPWRWAWAGLGVVVAVLSKQMGVFLVILPILGWWALRHRPENFWRGWPALLLAAGIGAAPLLAWNAAHQGVTFSHTQEHFAAPRWSPAEILNTLPEFLATQAGLLNPVLFLVMASILWAGLRHFRSLGDRERWLLVWGGLPLLVFVLLACRQRVLPNWPLVFYLPMLVLLGGFFAGQIPRWEAWRLRRWLPVTLWTGAVLAGLLMLLPPVLPALGLGGGRLDGAHRMRGWRALAEAVGPFSEAFPALPSRADLTAAELRASDRTGVITQVNLASPSAPSRSASLETGDVLKADAEDRVLTDDDAISDIPQEARDGDRFRVTPAIIAYATRYPVDALTFYLPDHPRVYRWSTRGVQTQHELWPGPTAFLGQDVLVLSEVNLDPPETDTAKKSPLRPWDLAQPTQIAAFRESFDDLHPLGEVTVQVGPTRVRRYWLYRGENLRSWESPGVK